MDHGQYIDLGLSIINRSEFNLKIYFAMPVINRYNNGKLL